MNFRTLWWLVTREACWQVLCRREGYTLRPWTRRAFARADTYTVLLLARRLLTYHPDRRWL